MAYHRIEKWLLRLPDDPHAHPFCIKYSERKLTTYISWAKKYSRLRHFVQESFSLTELLPEKEITKAMRTSVQVYSDVPRANVEAGLAIMQNQGWTVEVVKKLGRIMG